MGRDAKKGAKGRLPSVGYFDLVNGRKAYLLRKNSVLEGQTGAYSVVGRAGTGGFAAVYSAREIGTDRLVAIKISSDLKADSPGSKRTRRELKILMDCKEKVGTDHIVDVLDYGECEGRPFFVMEHLGMSHPPGHPEYPFNISESDPQGDMKRQAFMLGILESVRAVHRAGYIHRDIKAGNILFREGKWPKPLLVDFGSAVPIEEGDETIDYEARRVYQVTETEQSVATPGRGPGDAMYCPRWDIFEIGHLIRDLFAENVPSNWGYIINKCISQRPKFRYDDVDSLIEDVRSIEKIQDMQYWSMRKRRISEQRKNERLIDDAEEERVDIFQFVRPDTERTRSNISVWTIDLGCRETCRRFVSDDGDVLELPENTILIVQGKGILEANVKGPSSSIVVLRDYAVFHNTNDEYPPENGLLYALIGPGTYLNFPNIDYNEGRSAFFGKAGTRRIFRDMDATTALRFGSGLNTFSEIEEETVAGINDSDLPDMYKNILVKFFKGNKFSVIPPKPLLRMHLDISKRVPIAQIEGSNTKWLVDTGCPVSEPPEIARSVSRFLNEKNLLLRGLDRLKRYTMIDYSRQLLETSESPIPFEGQECPIGGDAADSWKIRLDVNGEEHEYYVETGAAYSYIHDLFDKADGLVTRVRDFGVSGNVWDADVYKVRASFCGYDFDLLCADASDSEESVYAVPAEGVVGFEFFKNFAIMVDNVARIMKWRKI